MITARSLFASDPVCNWALPHKVWWVIYLRAQRLGEIQVQRQSVVLPAQWLIQCGQLALLDQYCGPLIRRRKSSLCLEHCGAGPPARSTLPAPTTRNIGGVWDDSDWQGWFHTHYAAMSENIKCLRHLREHDFSAVNCRGETPLALILKYKLRLNSRTLRCLEWILIKTRFHDLCRLDEDGGAPIHYAVRNCKFLTTMHRIANIYATAPTLAHNEAEGRFHGSGANGGQIWSAFQKALKYVDASGRNCLTWAVQYLEINSLQWFLHHGPDHLVSDRDRSGLTVIHHAARVEASECLSILVDWFQSTRDSRGRPRLSLKWYRIFVEAAAWAHMKKYDHHFDLIRNLILPEEERKGTDWEETAWEGGTPDTTATARRRSSECREKELARFTEDLREYCAVQYAKVGNAAGLLRLFQEGWRATFPTWFALLNNFAEHAELVHTVQNLQDDLPQLRDHATQANALHVVILQAHTAQGALIEHLVLRTPALLEQLMIADAQTLERRVPRLGFDVSPSTPKPRRAGMRPVGLTPLMLSVVVGNEVAFTRLLELSGGTDPILAPEGEEYVWAPRGGRRVYRHETDQGWTLPHYVAAYGTLAMLRLLAKRGYNMAAKDQLNRKPVHLTRSVCNNLSSRKKLLFLKITLSFN